MIHRTQERFGQWPERLAGVFHKTIDCSQQMLRWRMTFGRKLVKQSFLTALTFPIIGALQSPDRIEPAPPCPDNSCLFQHNPLTAAIYETKIRPLSRPFPGQFSFLSTSYLSTS
jgi:hypothetical protein